MKLQKARSEAEYNAWTKQVPVLMEKAFMTGITAAYSTHLQTTGFDCLSKLAPDWSLVHHVTRCSISDLKRRFEKYILGALKEKI